MNSPTSSSPRPDDEAAKLVADISKLMAEAEEMLIESTSHHAEEKIELLRGRHETAAEQRLADRYAAIKSKVAAAAGHTDEFIRTNPYETAAIALGLGLLLGACCGRRRE